jgi:hypothetical protein
MESRRDVPGAFTRTAEPDLLPAEAGEEAVLPAPSPGASDDESTRERLDELILAGLVSP